MVTTKKYSSLRLFLPESRTHQSSRNVEFKVAIMEKEIGFEPKSLKIEANISSPPYGISPSHPFPLSDQQEMFRQKNLDRYQWHYFTIHLNKPLPAGQYIFWIECSDQLGKPTRRIARRVTIEIAPPQLSLFTPLSGKIMRQAPAVISFQIDARVTPEILLQTPESLSDIGTEKARALRQKGITSIKGLIGRSYQEMQVQSMHPIDVKDLLTRAHLVGQFRFNKGKLSSWSLLSLNELANKSEEEWRSILGQKASHVKQFIQRFRHLQLAFDRTVRDHVCLQQFRDFAHSGIASIEYFIDDQDHSAHAYVEDNLVTCQIPDSLSEGLHRIYVNVFFKSGLKSSVITEFSIDSTPPKISELRPVSGSFFTALSTPISVKISDALSAIDTEQCEILLDGQSTLAQIIQSTNDKAITLQYVPEKLTEGEHSWQVRTSDVLGNSFTSENIKFTIDNTSPIVQLDINEENQLVDTPFIKLTGSIVEAHVETLTIGTTEITQITEGRFEVEVLLEIGENHFAAKAKDKAGNEATSNTVLVVKIDDASAAITGQVMDAEGQPLHGVLVNIVGHPQQATSNANGRFYLLGVPEGRINIEIDGPDGYEGLTLEVQASYGQITPLADAIYLLPDFSEQPTTVTTDDRRSTAVNALYPDLEVSWDTETGLIFPEGHDQLTLGLVSADRFPINLKQIIPGGRIAALGPAGLRAPQGTKIGIKLPNDLQLPAGTQLPVLLLNRDDFRFTLGCMATVNEDGTSIETLPGDGLPHFSFAAPMIPQPKISILQEDSHVPGADAIKGGLELEIKLPSFRVLEKEIEPTIRYSSRAASPEVHVTGVFRGVKEIHLEEKMEPYTVSKVSTAQQVKVHKAVQRYRTPDKWWELGKIEDGNSEVDEVMYLPVGSSVYGQLPKGRILEGDANSPKKWEEYTDFKLNSQNVEVYRLSSRVQNNVTKDLWPSAVSSKYFFARLESIWKKLFGKNIDKAVTNAESGETEFVKSYQLPPNLTVSQHLRPRLANGTHYPTGIYSFLALYNFEFEGYVTETSHAMNTLFLDEEYFAFQKKKLSEAETKPNPSPSDSAAIKQLREFIEGIEQLKSNPVTTSLRQEWIEPVDLLFKNLNGTTILHNLHDSPLGRGWSINGVQHLFAIGKSRALIIDGNEKVVFAQDDFYIREVYHRDGVDPVFTSLMATLPSSAKITRRTSLQDGYKLVQNELLLGGKEWTYGCDTRRQRIMKFTSMRYRQHIKLVIDFHEYWDGNYFRRVEENRQTIKTDHARRPSICAIAANSQGEIYVADPITHQIFKISSSGYQIFIGAFIQMDPVVNANTQINHGLGGLPYNGDRRFTHTFETYLQILTDFTPDGRHPAISSINYPAGLVFDDQDRMIYSERGFHRIRRVYTDPTNAGYKIWETIAGRDFGDGERFDPSVTNASHAVLPSPGSLIRDKKGNIYCLLDLAVTGFESHVIVKIDVNGILTHIAGNPVGTINTGIDATLYKMVGATDICIDRQDHIYVYLPGKIVIINPQGFVDDFAGGGSDVVTQASVPALSIRLGDKGKLDMDEDSNLMILDTETGNVMTITRNLLSTSGTGQLRGSVGYHDSKLEKSQDGTWIRMYKNGRTVVFNEYGYELTDSDRNGNTINYHWDSANLLKRIDYPLGAHLDFEYGASNHLTAIHDHAGRSTLLEINQTYQRFPANGVQQLRVQGLPEAVLVLLLPLEDRSFSNQEELDTFLTELLEQTNYDAYVQSIKSLMRPVYDLRKVVIANERTFAFTYSENGELLSKTEN